MKILFLCILLLISTAIAKAQEGVIYVVNASDPVNVRACPSTNCAVVTRLQPLAEFMGLEIVEGTMVSGSYRWLHLTYEGADGYIHAAFAEQITSGEIIYNNCQENIPLDISPEIEKLRTLIPEERVTAEGYLIGNEYGLWYQDHLLIFCADQRLNFNNTWPFFRSYYENGLTINGEEPVIDLLAGYLVDSFPGLFIFQNVRNEMVSIPGLRVASPVVSIEDDLIGYRTLWVTAPLNVFVQGRGGLIDFASSGSRAYSIQLDQQAIYDGEVDLLYTVNDIQHAVVVGDAVVFSAFLEPIAEPEPSTGIYLRLFYTLQELSGGLSPREVLSDITVQDAILYTHGVLVRNEEYQ